MRARPVIMFAPPSGGDPHLLEAVKDFAVEQFVAQASIEALNIAVLPRAAWFDLEGGAAEPAKPFPHRVGEDLGTVVGTDALVVHVR